MKYQYQAKTKEGEAQVGFVEAPSREAAASVLSGHDLFILTINEVEKPHFWNRIASWFGRVKRKDMMIFTRQMATLFEAQLPLPEVLTTLQKQTRQPALKEAVFQISEDIDAGLSFSQALERQSNVFSPFMVSMVRSAEVTGNLEKVIGFLADYEEKETALITKARSALIYPGIIVGLFVVVAIIMVTVVFPQIEPVFTQSGVALPWFTRILIGSGTFLRRWWIAFILLFGLLVAMVLDYFQTKEGKALRDDLFIRAPVVKRVYLPLTITRLSNAMSMLLLGGVPMAQAIEIVGQTIDNEVYKDLMLDVSTQVRQGIHLAEAMEKYPLYFPALATQMIGVGEATGQVSQMFSRISNFYGKEAENLINNLVDLIQPVLMIAIGLLVGILFASVLLPLYQLTTNIQ
jgi:type IV pilus assembly protein PilC